MDTEWMDETERADERFRHLETWPRTDVLAALLDGQASAILAVRAALLQIDAAVAAASARLAASSSSRLVYAGAGTSGRLAMLDGVELGPTFSWPSERCVFLAAGGADSFARALEGAEDDAAAAEAAVVTHDIEPRDVVVALAASGRTPFTIAVVEAARMRGALTIGIANNPDTPLLAVAEHAVLLRTGAEVLAGSTRLSAGTAQKIALNLFSTALMIELGRVFRGRMVDMRPTNAKLHRRAVRMIAEVAGCSDTRASKALEDANGDIREAILAAEADHG